MTILSEILRKAGIEDSDNWHICDLVSEEKLNLEKQGVISVDAAWIATKKITGINIQSNSHPDRSEIMEKVFFS